MTLDIDALRSWYRSAMVDRIAELRALRPAVRDGIDRDAPVRLRSIGYALRGSGGCFGFGGVSTAGLLLEEADERDLLRRLDGVVALLRAVTRESRPGTALHGWLWSAAGLDPEGHPDLPSAEAWPAVAERAGVDQEALAATVADAYGLRLLPGDAVPDPAALRLVPGSLLHEHRAVPIREDGVGIEVASATPVDLVLESRIHRVTGRRVRFLVTWPDRIRALLEGLERSPSVGRPAPPRTDGPPSILLADDDTGGRVVARATLERKGYRVTEAKDGQEVLDRLDAGESFDLMVLDLSMPRVGGRDVVRAMRAPPRSLDTPVVILTGADDRALEVSLIEDGADDYIRKPLDPSLFQARVAATLRRSGG